MAAIRPSGGDQNVAGIPSVKKTDGTLSVRRIVMGQSLPATNCADGLGRVVG